LLPAIRRNILRSLEEGNIVRIKTSESREDILSNLAANIRALRRARGLSQSGLADRSGISRRMIVAVETGEANVSLSTVDRLAAALQVSFSQIVRSPEAADSRRILGVAWRGESQESRAILLGAAPASRETELWLWSLGEGERYPSEAGSGSWHEMLYVVEGRLAVEAADGRHLVDCGDFLIFSSERPYVFVNAGGGILRFIRNVVL
jgi:transcriptional regulator with XRE-family HTH domain